MHMPQVYSKLFEMLTPEDNVTKSKVREFLKNIMTYDRLSDYWVYIHRDRLRDFITEYV